MSKYIAPQYHKSSFTCPHCQAHAQMHWNALRVTDDITSEQLTTLSICRCIGCARYSIWKVLGNDKIDFKRNINATWVMIFPKVASAPEPNEDMPQQVKAIYEEARQVEPHSKRAAAALLRLCLEHLLKQTGYDRKKIFDAIGDAVKDQIAEEVQQGMDLIRSYGNDAVHPVSEILWDDNGDDVPYLFHLLNEIVEVTITRKNKRDALYAKMSQTQRDAIDKRDGKK